MPIFYPRAKSPFDGPTLLDEFIASPIKFLVIRFHNLLLHFRGQPYRLLPHQHPIKVVCLSDTHCNTPSNIPNGDLLIHAGDLTNAGTVQEIQAQIDWLQSLPHSQKIIIAGNHDSFFDPKSRAEQDYKKTLDFRGIHYLRQESITLSFPSCENRRLNIHGSPQIPACGGPEFAFQHPRDTDTWTTSVPAETDVLVTHTPPQHHLDLGLGDRFLLKEVWRIRPTLHVFGHVHLGAGQQAIFWDEQQKAYERVMARRGSLFGDVFAVAAILDSLRMFFHGIKGIIWSRIWGGVARGGWMVNAALVYADSGKIGNPVRVIQI